MKTLLLFCFALLCLNVHAQHERDNWLFGNFAAVSFINGAPANLPNHPQDMHEGCSSISDSAGNLLFYTNGRRIWNAAHELMPQGLNLNSDVLNSAVQQALILPHPGNPNQYFVFYCNIQGGSLWYCIVDMTLEGGLGDVVSDDNLLLEDSDEKITAIKRWDGGYWVMAHDPAGHYNAFPLTASGVGAPVVSTVGIVNTASFGTIGSLRFSPTGNYIVNTQGGFYKIELASFDMTTGVVSNASELFSMGYPNSAYTAEFSPSGNALYVGNAFNTSTPCKLYQFDMTSGNPDSIAASALLIHTDSMQRGYLQLASNGKIYRSFRDHPYLAAINNPDSIGFACNYVDTAFVLNAGASCDLGLPNAPVTVIGVPPALPLAAFTSAQGSVCPNGCVNFTNESTDATTYQWFFEGGTPNNSTSVSPTICYAASGSYDVVLIGSNGSINDTLFMSNYITVHTPDVPTITQLNDTLFSSPAASYQWYQGSNIVSGATNSFYIAPSSGTYSVHVTDGNGCAASALLDAQIFLHPQALIYPGNDTFICQNTCVSLASQSTNATSFEWFFQGGSPSYSTEEFPADICYFNSGAYNATLVAHNGPYSDTSAVIITVSAMPTTIAQFNDTLFVNDVPSGSTYQWLFNGDVINGATQEFIVPTHNGTYTVNVTSPEGCSGSDALVVTSVAIDELLGDVEFSLYPNPADRTLTITTPHQVVLQMKLYNMLGQLVRNERFEKNLEIDVTQLPAGVYSAAIQTDNNLTVKQLIVTHPSR